MGFTRAELESFRDRAVPDLAGPDVRLVFVGINPSLWTAGTRTHFSHPGNRFYPALRLAGIIDRDVDRAAGMTDDDRASFVRRGHRPDQPGEPGDGPGRRADADELRAGAERLRTFVRTHRPLVVAVAGHHRLPHGVRPARGRAAASSPSRLEGARLWVVPNPSGLNAHETTATLAAAYAEPARAAGLLPAGPPDDRRPGLTAAAGRGLSCRRPAAAAVATRRRRRRTPSPRATSSSACLTASATQSPSLSSFARAGPAAGPGRAAPWAAAPPPAAAPPARRSARPGWCRRPARRAAARRTSSSAARSRAGHVVHGNSPSTFSSTRCSTPARASRSASRSPRPLVIRRLGHAAQQVLDLAALGAGDGGCQGAVQLDVLGGAGVGDGDPAAAGPALLRPGHPDPLAPAPARRPARRPAPGPAGRCPPAGVRSCRPGPAAGALRRSAPRHGSEAGSGAAPVAPGACGRLVLRWGP